MEELVWHPNTGALLTHAPSTYKLPTANDTPAHFRVALYEAPNPADTVHRSKAVGEPPLLLPLLILLMPLLQGDACCFRCGGSH